MGQAVSRYGVTVLFLTSGLFGLVVDRRLDDLRGVRQFVAGGDVVPVPQALRVVEELPGCRMINGYGPTENTTFTTWRTVSRADAGRPSIPIGGPVGNTCVHVLDGAMRPVLLGVRGELYTGGLGLARGYFRRPDLTAARFVPDPLAASPESASTSPATSPAGSPTAASSSSAAWTCRSRSAASASSSARWSPPSAAPRRGGGGGGGARGPSGRPPLVAYLWPAVPCRRCRRRPSCRPTCAPPCPTTWCPRPSWSSTACR